MHALYKLSTSETANGSINQSKCVRSYAYPANKGKSLTNREQSYQYGFPVLSYVMRMTERRYGPASDASSRRKRKGLPWSLRVRGIRV
jgi:hypothetical protein